MKNLLVFLTPLFFFLLLFSCQQQETFLPEITPEQAFNVDDLLGESPVDPNQIALEILGQTKWPNTAAATREKAWVRPGTVLKSEKTYITEDIVHYAFEIAITDTEYNKVGLHRVVKETAPGVPIKTYHTLFYQHGDAKNFTGMMLPGQLSPNTPDDFGLAVYLAENGVDVWGIDQAWTLVPAEVTDHSFMADWGIDRQVQDLRVAVAVARSLRYWTGNGVGRMLLAGYSSGVPTGFATLNLEADRPMMHRQVKGFIPIDLAIKTDLEEWKAVFRGEYERTLALLESEAFGDFVPFQLLGNLATSDPNGPSPVIPGFNNMQAAMFFGAGNIFGTTPFHYLAGVWEEGFPGDIRYLTIDQWFDFLLAAVPWEAARFIHDYSVWVGEVEDVPWDDNFAEITVPILNVNPAGGFGRVSEYGTTFLGSKDITQLNIQLLSDEQVMEDFAHIDIFIANNAEELVWQPMLEWIKQH